MKNTGFFIRFAAILTLLSLICTSLWGCKKDDENKGTAETHSAVYYEYFDTVTQITDYSGGSKESFDSAMITAESLLGYYHKLFDIYNEYSGINNLATVNKNAGVQPVKVDGALLDFLEYARELYYLTDGNVNIAMGSVLSIWHEYRTIGVAVPSMEILTEANQHTDIEKMIINRENSTVYLADAEMSLDVGAIAKGYACQKIAEALEAGGYSSYVLDLGGNLKAIGHKPDGSTWRTAVRNPDVYADDPYIYYFNIADTSVVTSGDYQRYYTVGGVNYHHIINKGTLMPADYFSSVTIITKNSGFADGLSTALFNMDYESGLALVSSLDGVSVVWVTKDRQVKTYGI